jgi:hypothetical protein
VSVKPPINDHLQNVRLTLGSGAKPDSMIVGRKNGSAARTSGEQLGQALSDSVQKTPPLNFQNDRLRALAGMAILRDGYPSGAVRRLRRRPSVGRRATTIPDYHI